MTKSYVRTATRTTLKVEANLTQILNFKANFHAEFEPFFKKKIYANNGGHFKIVSIILSTEDLIISKNSSNIKVPKYCHAQVSLPRTNTFRKERLSIRIHVVTYVPKLQVMFLPCTPISLF